MNNRFFYFLIIFILWACCIYAEAAYDRHVLYISSYHPAFPTFQPQIDGIKSVFEKENILLDIEFMDTKRFPGQETVKYFHNTLSFKLKKLPPYNAVIAADDAAFDYAISQRNNLFHNIPIFYCGVNNIEKAASFKNNIQIRGVVESVSIKETLELVRDFFPERDKIAVITDGSVTGQSDFKEFISVTGLFPLKPDIISLQYNTFDQLNFRVKNLGADYTILLLSAYTDSTGETRLFHNVLSEIYKNSRVPIFHLWEHGMGNGIFGGKLVRHYEQGRAAAEMALSYLKGTPAGKIIDIKESPNVYTFDYNELVRFNIPLRKLPEGSIIINKPLSFYEMHKVEIITGSVIITALLYIVIILILESRRLRKMVVERTQELAESEERWKFSLEGAGQVVWDWDVNNNKIFISRKWNEALGLNNEETLADIEEWFKEIHEDDREKTRVMMGKHLRGEKPLYENFHRIITKEGLYRWVLSRGKVIERLPDGTPQRVIGTATDVTELKQIEDEINKSRRMLQLVLDTIPIGVFWKDKDLRFLGCNNSFARLAGAESTESIVGKKDEDLFDSELAMSHKAVDVEILNTGTSKLNYEDQLSLPTGKVRILRKSKVPLTDNNGEIIGVLGTYEDVTVQKNLREETFRIQKLESVGILASGIAHDFNNLLMAIAGSLSVIRMSEDPSEKTMYWIEQAEKSCFAATELTTRLITFSRGGAPILQKENIVEVINDAVDSGSAGSSITVNYINHSPDTFIMTDFRQIRQVILNLIENSKEAMPHGGFIDIISSAIILEENNRLDLKPGRYMMISFKDSGPGIPEDIIGKIFDPYFSTKEMVAHKGQGLGLAICHSIITQHRGKITVRSNSGEGALFNIYLPFEG
jgi:PAS domain S-box-containing protein